MPATTDVSTVEVSTGLHEPVSNIPEEVTAAPVAQLSDPPSEGVGAEAPPTTNEGEEVVDGYKPIVTEISRLFAVPATAEAMEAHQETMAVVPEIWVAPDTTGVRDIGEASFGAPPGLEAIIGVDNRVQINNTAVYPWRAHASLLITAADNSQWIGTGWFIGPHTLMTAGHVVHIKNSGVEGRDGWVKRITVMPGRNANSLPYGSVVSTSFRSVVGWTVNGDQNYDYGAIIIPTNLGTTTGWFGFGVWSDAELVAATGNISGYPGDKPAGTQWYHARKVVSVDARKVYYDIDTMGGQSGSAVYRIIGVNRYGIAVHAYGGTTTNSGTRITSPVFNNMLAWKA
jgi:V8-like Glu-specific endopeptidase